MTQQSCRPRCPVALRTLSSRSPIVSSSRLLSPGGRRHARDSRRSSSATATKRLRRSPGRGHPTLLIVDLSLPRVDGFAVVRKIRRQTSERRDAHHRRRRARVAAVGSARAGGTAGNRARSSPLDIDNAGLSDVLVAESRAMRRASQTEPLRCRDDIAAPRTSTTSSIARRSKRGDGFSMPASIGYLRVDDEENLTFHVAARDPGRRSPSARRPTSVFSARSPRRPIR